MPDHRWNAERPVVDGRYRLEAVIARGGMSTVHLATDTRLERPVAVKVLDPGLAADPSFAERLALEARSVARLTHPGLVQVFDQGTSRSPEPGDDAQPVPFLVMELVPGGTLRELLDERGPMPPYAVAAVLRPLLSALDHAHRAGLVHRDIKPENVLISPDGAVKLADFGLVRPMAAARVTSRSVVLGTAAYLAPEQLSGQETDGRTDLYAVGILAYELLTGQVPFDGDSSAAVAYRRLGEDVPAPSAAGPPGAVSDQLDDVVLRATRREPVDRTGSAREMLDEIDRVAAAEGFPEYRVPTARDSAWSRAARAASAATAPGTETVFDAAARTSGHHRSATRVETRSRPAPDPLPGPAVGGPGVDAPVEHAHHRTPAAPGGAHPVPAVRGPRIAPRPGLGIAVVLVVLALALALAIGGWWVGSGRFTTVPTVHGMAVSEASSTAETAGLAPDTRRVYNDDAPPSAVAGVEPAEGTRIPRGGRVTLLVSLGPPVVPELTGGRDAAAVEQSLRDRTLRPVRAAAEHSADVPEGAVARVEPAPGTAVHTGSEVRVHLSSGPEPVAVPTLVGHSEQQAREALERAGLAVGPVTQQFDPSVTDGGVTAGGVEAGTTVPRGTAVALTVSSAVRVPLVLGARTDRARTLLREAGLIAGGRAAEGRSADGLVYGQVPLPGKVVERGTSVELSVVG